LLVIGGGPIGVELAQAHRRLGADVTIIEADTLLNREDPDAVEVIRSHLKKEGVNLREKLKAVRVDKSGDTIRISLDDGALVEGSHILVAVGRRANLTELDLAKANIELSDGKLRLDSRLRTTNKRIYAIGDAAGGAQFTHVAGDHASTFVRNVLFKAPTQRRDDLAPRVTYCAPEIASIGLTEASATSAGEKFSVARWAMAENDRARAEADTEGFVKTVIGKGGRILGVTIVGEGAGDLIAPWSLAIANKVGIRAFTNMIAAYPTRSEISKRAAGAYYTPALFSGRTRKLIRLLSIFD
jgi:pyruvate/2-oxoglutarate dehydrogenase complex dihydrolipoamide dehydrogenase (E3) component